MRSIVWQFRWFQRDVVDMVSLVSLIEYLVIATVTSLSLLKPRVHRARHRERWKS